MEKRKLDRRKFFNMIGYSAIGAALLSSFPFKFFDRDKRIQIRTKVKIHPSAIKRNK